MHEELIFPLSSKVIIVSTKRNKPKVLNPVFSINFDLLLFHYAHRYIASSDKQYLEFIAKQANENLIKPGRADKLKKDIFNNFC